MDLRKFLKVEKVGPPWADISLGCRQTVTSHVDAFDWPAAIRAGFTPREIAEFCVAECGAKSADRLVSFIEASTPPSGRVYYARHYEGGKNVFYPASSAEEAKAIAAQWPRYSADAVYRKTFPWGEGEEMYQA